MTSAQETALTSGLLAFVVVWGGVLVPQLISHHARFGRVHVRRVVTTAAVTLYSCLAVAVVLLPLPRPGDRHLTQTVQPTPFQWVDDVRGDVAGHGISAAFTSPAFQQFAMNVLLFVPLGVFAVLLWRRGLTATTLLGFGASLLVEFTQLTANLGTAPYAYRVFDVDDLMANTAGAALGWVAATLFVALRRLRASSDGASPSPAAPTVPLESPLPGAPGVRASGVPGAAPHVGPRTRPSSRPR